MKMTLKTALKIDKTTMKTTAKTIIIVQRDRDRKHMKGTKEMNTSINRPTIKE